MKILEPLDLALARTRTLLFRPFDVSVWACFGVIVFLNMLFQGGSSFAYLFNVPGTLPTFNDGAKSARDFLAEHSAFLLGVGGVALLLYILYLFLSTWITSRGQLMFVRALATGDHRIDVNWRETARLSGSLFMFRIVVAVFGLLYYASVVGIAVVLLSNRGFPRTFDQFLSQWPMYVPIVFLWLLGSTTLWTIRFFQWNFVTPIMWLRDERCFAAWGTFLPCLWGNIIILHGYALFRLLIYVVLGVAGTFVGCLTCFIGALPVVSHAILAPFYVFDRAFALYVLESMGPEFRIMSPLETTSDDPFGERAPRDLMR